MPPRAVLSARPFLAVLVSVASGSLAFASEQLPKAAQMLHGEPAAFGSLTNSMLTSALITVCIVLGFRLLVGRPGLVPTRGQAVVESLLEALKGLFEPIVGKKAMPIAFPLLVTLFIFIVLHNWSGLLPFVGTMGWGHVDPATGKFLVENPLLRPHNADLNGTVALALLSFGAWLVMIFKYAGAKLVWHDLFGNKAEKGDVGGSVYVALTLVFLLVGLIEVVAILIRPVTLSMRLFGNVFGGENVMHFTSFFPAVYFLELLVGFVQGLVFTLLSAVYVGLICNHGDEHHDGKHGHGKEAAAH